MKTKLLIVAALMVNISMWAAGLVKLEFTSPDGTEWKINNVAGDPNGPEHPSYLGQDNAYLGVNGIGSKTNSFNGSSYHIDVAKNQLILGDGFDVGLLRWSFNGASVTVDVGTYYGFCIDANGVGWLASQENDGDTLYILWQVNLSTAACTYIDSISTFMSPMTVNGMIVTRTF